VADRLGAEVTFVEARSADRETLLERRQVDLVVAAYSITDERRELVDFAGPYFLAGQSVLVRRKNSDITGPTSLDDSDWDLCSVPGSTSATKVKQRFAIRVTLREFPTYGDCVEALQRGEVDAVTTDDVVLAGFTAARPEKLKVVGEPFSVERYGIGLHKGDPRQAEVTAALRRLVSDGTWQRVVQENLGKSRYRIPSPPEVLDRP
jgi:glutamate transport system substrate-binding protein